MIDPVHPIYVPPPPDSGAGAQGRKKRLSATARAGLREASANLSEQFEGLQKQHYLMQVADELIQVPGA